MFQCSLCNIQPTTKRYVQREASHSSAILYFLFFVSCFNWEQNRWFIFPYLKFTGRSFSTIHHAWKQNNIVYNISLLLIRSIADWQKQHRNKSSWSSWLRKVRIGKLLSTLRGVNFKFWRGCRIETDSRWCCYCFFCHSWQQKVGQNWLNKCPTNKGSKKQSIREEVTVAKFDSTRLPAYFF